MRIIGYLDTKGYKSTVFQNNNRLIVKFEADNLEQTFKFPQSEQLQTLRDIELLLTPAFYHQVVVRFKEMYESQKLLLHTLQEEADETWDEII